MKYVVCFSGGHSSALAAVETVRRFGRNQVILLNHDISSKVETAKIKNSEGPYLIDKFRKDLIDKVETLEFNLLDVHEFGETEKVFSP